MTWTALAWNILYALLIFAAGNLLSAWLRDFVALSLERTRLDILVRRLLVSLVRPVVVALAAFAALAQLGIPMTSFAAIAGAVTLAIGMALRGSLSNVASGAMLLTLRPFEKGEFITAGGHSGTVHDLGLFHTTLHGSAGNTITLPNDTVWGGAIVNVSDRPTRRIEHVFTLVPKADIGVAEIAMLDVLGKDERILETPAPSVTYQTSEVGVVLTAFGHVDNADFGGARSDTCRGILERLRDAGVELATRTV